MDDIDRQPELPLARELRDLYKELAGVSDGELATYIPPLANADPGLFGLAIVTVDGHCYTAGDVDVPFTIQSVSKPFAFGLALDDLGVDTVLERVGVEPTGDAFNSITVDEASGRPFNPMVNAGAIVTTSLLGHDTASRDRRVLDGLGRFAGRRLDVDDVVFDAERRTGDRNRAIAYLMRTFGMLREDVDAAVESYFRQCSVLVDVRDLTTMAATLANDGVNPVTGERALASSHVSRVLSVMSICGMYDYAGEWLYRIGLPAKSGVSGGVVAVLPGVCAIGSFSPPLDARGNSVRGIRACEQLARRFRLHVLGGRSAAPPVRRTYDVSAVRSTRRRPAAQVDLLRDAGRRASVVEVQGPLHFGSAETTSRVIVEHAARSSHLIVDLTRVTSMDEGALPVLEASLRSAAEHGVAIGAIGALAARLTHDVADAHPTIDAALERCEDDLLELLGHAGDNQHADLAAHELLAGLSEPEVDLVLDATTLERHPAGSTIFHEGDPADAVYLVLSGRVRVGLEIDGRRQRLTTIGPGGSFGEMAIVDGGVRSSSVSVEQDATCRVLTLDALASLEREAPVLVATIFRNLTATLSRRLRMANEEIRVLRA